MFCPKCSQQQPTGATRFCSRCGFTLGGIALVLENNGMIPQVPGQTLSLSRNRIMIEGALLTVFSWAVAFVSTFWFDASGIGEGIAQLTGLLFFILGLIGLVRFLYGFLFVKEKTTVVPDIGPGRAAQVLAADPQRSALPPQQFSAISDYPLRVNTKEMAPRASVTENTTRLLDQNSSTKNDLPNN